MNFRFFFLFFLVLVVLPIIMIYVVLFYSFGIADEVASAINVLDIASFPSYLSLPPKEFSIIVFVFNLFTPSVILWILAKETVLPESKQFFRRLFIYYRWLYFLLSIVGSIVAAYYVQTGTLIAINGNIGDRLLERLSNDAEKEWEMKEIAENKEKFELQEQENKVLNQILEVIIEIPTHLHQN